MSLPREQWRRNRLAINTTAALVFAGFTFVMPFLPLYVRECGVADDAAIASWSGLLITVAPLIAALMAPVWGRLGDRYGMKAMVERATLAMTVHWGLFGFARSVYELLALRVMLGLFGGFGTISMPMLVASTPKEHMSRSIGMLQTVQIVSSPVRPMVGRALSEALSATVLGNRLRSAPARRLLLWRLGGGALACFPMGLVSATSQLLVLRVALGLVAGGCMVVVYTLGSQIIPGETRATSFSFL